MSDADAPEMLHGAGLALWNRLNDDLEFEPHEAALALELCRTVALCEHLQRRLDNEGPVVDGERGPKINPLMAEVRQQRLVVARLIRALVSRPSTRTASRPSREVPPAASTYRKREGHDPATAEGR